MSVSFEVMEKSGPVLKGTAATALVPLPLLSNLIKLFFITASDFYIYIHLSECC